MKGRSAFWKWALLGAITSGLLLYAQAGAVGGVKGLLQVGETSQVRPLIEAQLGEIPLADGPGHDGQIYYAIGLDLAGDEVPELLDDGAYSYRRILYPALASLFGLLDGAALLWGMIVVTVLSTSIAAGLVGSLAARWGRSDWLAMAVVLNPGVWLSIRLLTVDMPALAFMCVALYAIVVGRDRGAGGWFALSALSKDAYLVTPAGLALDRRPRRWLYLVIPVLVLVLWMTWLTMTMGNGFTPRGNFALPFAGLVDASANWPNLELEEWFYLGATFAIVLAGFVVGLTRKTWLRWSILGWSALAVISSNWVWDFGNNAARVFAPIPVLIVLALAHPGAEVASPSEAIRDVALE